MPQWGTKMKPNFHTRWVAGFCLMVSLALSAHAVTPTVAAGWSHSMALTAEGKVLTWGSDNSGQLGIGRQTFLATPQRVPGMNLGSRASGPQLAAGTYHNAVVKADGTVWTWGDNLSGQLGDGSITAKSTPGAVPGFKQAVAVVAGFGFTAALKSDGSVWTWGSNEGGALGSGNTNPSYLALVPEQADLAGFPVSTLAAGFAHVVAVIEGSVVSWGGNNAGQLGVGDDISTPWAQFVPGPTQVVAVAAGVYHSMALDADGGVWTWGNNVDGRLGDGTTGNLRPYAYRLPGLPRMVAIAAGAQHSLAVAEDGSVWAWGNNEYLQLGVAGIDSRAVPAKVPGLSGITRIQTHYNHNIALDAAGNAWAWGAGTTGQLGDGSTATRAAPVRIPSLSGVLAADAGLSHSLAVSSDGQLQAWGEGLAGQLGLATDTDRTLPTTVSGLSGITHIAGGLRHSLAVQSDGTVWAWGYNLGGQLGDGTHDSRAKPVKVAGLGNVTQVSAGALQSLARKSDGTVWAWGGNTSGELGLGLDTLRSPPVQVSGLSAIQQVAAGFGFSLALRTDGSVWSWGGNDAGQLGVAPAATATTGGVNVRHTPARISGLPAAVSVVTGQKHAMALAADGTVWAWGLQTNGVLGNLQIEAGTSLPTQVYGLTDVVAIAAGSTHSMALRRDGSVYVWGMVLVEGNAYAVGIPIEFPGLGHASSISAGLAHSLVAKSDGTVWAWGLNIEGGLGDGTYAFRPDAVAVVNEQFSQLLDLNLAQPNFPVDNTQLPAFFVSTQKLGTKKNTSLSVDLRGLPSPPAMVASAKAQAPRGYNIYVAAALPTGTQTLAFQLDSTGGWGNLVWPMGEYLRDVALNSQDSVIRAQILTDTDLTGLEDASIFVGYGLDANEMASAGRYRLIYKVPK